MDQPLISSQQSDRYGGVPLGVESAWPTSSYGAPTAVPGLSSTPSSSPKRDFGVGVASSLLVALLLGTASAADGAPYAPAEYDFSGVWALEPSAFGIVETVREFALHAEELVVRLDDGRAVKVLLEGSERFQPGERVRLVGGRVLRT